MRRQQKINWVTALFLVLTPLIAVVWGIPHIAMNGVSWAEVAFFALFIPLTGLSITAGYHRHFAHGAYECRRFVKVFYLLFGAAAFQHSVLSWASDHRRHHLNIDEDADPYNINRGFLWAHIGWLMIDEGTKVHDFSNVPDLVADPWVRFQDKYYFPLAAFMGFGVPFLIGMAFGNPWGCLLWAGLFRIIVVHHSTFLVNSLAHTLGRRPYSTAVSARDSVVTALLTFGEGYHNFHHRFATDYRNGVRHHQWDPTKWLIRGMAAVGWAHDLYRVPREKIVAAELQVDLHEVLERWKDRSEHAAAYVRQRVADVATAVEHSAARLGNLERELAKVRKTIGAGRDRQLDRLRADIRAARREFNEARSRWREALRELSAMRAMPQAA
jgi:stearoyl-CoA desaturase (delta-9 desaturase)